MKVTFGLKPEGFNPDNILLSFLEAQRFGFDKAWLTDHLHETIMSEEYSLAEVWTTLSYLACTLDKLRLGICILNVNWRHPVLTEKAGGYPDILSGGRFKLVLGVGLREEEHFSFGFPFDSPRKRIERCARATQWLGQSPFRSHSGPYRLQHQRNFLFPAFLDGGRAGTLLAA